MLVLILLLNSVASAKARKRSLAGTVFYFDYFTYRSPELYQQNYLVSYYIVCLLSILEI